MSGENKVNILLVDDRPENLLAFEAILENDEYNLIKASSGEEALKYLLKYDFATILLDVQMPEMDGFATAKLIKSRERTRNIPIIFVTANYLDPKHIFIGYSIGAIDYILKPFDPIVLQAKVAGFVEIFKLNQKLVYQADMLAEKTNELEKTLNELSMTTSHLRESETLANVISETAIDSMIIIDNNGCILKVNPAVKIMFQYDESEILGEDIFRLFSCERARKYVREVLQSANNKENICRARNLEEVNATRKDGTHFPAELQMGIKYVGNKCVIACTIRDITKKKQDQEIIRHMAYHDGLTNLPNRRNFMDRLNSGLELAKENQQSLVLMYLDMDVFKYINDSLGHHVGDKLLQEFAIRLAEYAREDDFVARNGGDEFSILLFDTDRETAIEIAERVLEGIQKPFYIDEYELYITASIGISVYPYDGEDSTALMKNADTALYHAKEKGKNQYKIYHSGMNLQSYRAFMLQNDLRKAIERQEFFLVYQPRINIETGKITSVEALLRWNHPNLGLISPSEFIPLAEESGQIIAIGEWVLRSACKQNKAWQQAGLYPVRTAVNFSAQQFMQKDLVGTISQILCETDLHPDMIEIEITESVILENEESVINTLNQIREMGIWISIDDFGTGYSSLNYLRRYPVNSIKIDKCFVQDISNIDSNSSSIVSAIVAMSHGLHMSVVAEGVETTEQLDILRKKSCDEIQGYVFSPPVPAEEIEELLCDSHQYQDKIRAFDTGISSEIVPAESFEEQYNQKIIDTALMRIKKVYSITTREMEVFRLIVDGFTNKEISKKLMISEQAVRKHILNIFRKINVNDRILAIAKVYQAYIEEKIHVLSKHTIH